MDGTCLRGHTVDVDPMSRVCPNCGGYVRGVDEVEITVTVPAGALAFIVQQAERMASLRLRDEQDSGPRGLVYSITDLLEEQLVGAVDSPITLLGIITAARAAGKNVVQNVVYEDPL
jgi:hypothetical protein